jgi:hypothetical protein
MAFWTKILSMLGGYQRYGEKNHASSFTFAMETEEVNYIHSKRR